MRICMCICMRICMHACVHGTQQNINNNNILTSRIICRKSLFFKQSSWWSR